MTRVIGVRFRRAGKVYFFAPGKYKIRTGDKVIVETARGVEFGSVVTGPKEVEDDKILQPLKPVIRIATADDIRREEKNREKEKEAFSIWQVCSAPGSSFGRSACGMKRRSAGASVSAAGSFAAIPICRNLHRYLSRWRRSRICL